MLNLTEGGVRDLLDLPFRSGAKHRSTKQHGCSPHQAPIFSSMLKIFLVSNELIVFSLDFFPWYSAHTV